MNNHAKPSKVLQMRQNTEESMLIALDELRAFQGLMRNVAIEGAGHLAGRENGLPRPCSAGRLPHGGRALPHLARLPL